MPLTPIDIQQKTFGPELRGYNMDEVDDFLDEVVATLKDYDQRIRDAQDRIRALEAEVATRGEDETAISRALVAAQKQADAVLDEAHQEAERIRSDAFDEADQLRSDRDAERMALTQEMARMRATVADLKRRILELASTAESDLDAMDVAIADASESMVEPAATASPDLQEPADEDDVVPSGPGQHLGGWESTPVASDDEQMPHWDQEPTIEEPAVEDPTGEAEPEPGWETPRREWQTEREEGPSDSLGAYPEADEAEENLGGLADEMADEATPDSESEAETSSPPSRRPWERGSV